MSWSAVVLKRISTKNGKRVVGYLDCGGDCWDRNMNEAMMFDSPKDAAQYMSEKMDESLLDGDHDYQIVTVPAEYYIYEIEPDQRINYLCDEMKVGNMIWTSWNYQADEAKKFLTRNHAATYANKHSLHNVKIGKGGK